MGVRIYTNIDAMDADRHLGVTSLQLSKTIQRLSSGLRINSAADDAAGLAISERLRAQVRGNQQAVRNAQDGLSLFQTAEGALDEVHSMLQRARELTVEAANGTISTGDRNSIQQELYQLGSAIDRIANTTQFNTLTLMDGTFGTLTLQVGPNSGNTYTLTVQMQAMSTGALTLNTILSTTTALLAATYNAQLASLDSAIDSVSTFRGILGAKFNAMEHTIASLNVASENQASAESRIRDLDVANETVNFTKLQILQQAGTAVLAQANVAPQTVLQLLR
jgi:flagellin